MKNIMLVGAILFVLFLSGCPGPTDSTGNTVKQEPPRAVLTFFLEDGKNYLEVNSGSTVSAFIEAQNAGVSVIDGLKVQFKLEDPSLIEIEYNGQNSLQQIEFNETIGPQEQTQRKRLTMKLSSKIARSETLVTATLLDRNNKQLDQKIVTLVIKKR